MKNLKQLILILTLVANVVCTKAQSGKCLDPIPVKSANGQCTDLDSFYVKTLGVNERFLSFTAAFPQYVIKTYIKNFSSIAGYSVSLYNDSCSNLSANQILCSTFIYGDTVFLSTNNFTIGNDYLLKIENSDTNVAVTYYQVCLLGVAGPTIGVCPPISIPAGGCNLVCNGDFEYGTTPSPVLGVMNADGWGTANAGSPDLYSTSVPLGQPAHVPCNYEGFQNPYSGNNYAGMICYFAVSPTTWVEYLQTKLLSPLIVGKVYQFSFWVSLADFSNSKPLNISVFTSSIQASYGTANPIPLTPIYSETNLSIISDINNWKPISFTYTPSSANQQFLIIGQNGSGNSGPLTPPTYSFCANTVGFPNNSAYTYIDNVSVNLVAPSVGTISAACAGNPITISASCGAVSPTPNYNWAWGDGSATNTGTVSSATHSYSLGGVYNVTLTTVDGPNTYTSTQSVTITPLTASFTYTNTCANNLQALFTGSASCTGSSPNYTWLFGDGNTYSSSVPVGVINNYASAGIYTVTLIVTNGTATTSVTQTISILSSPTVAIISNGSGALCVRNLQTFSTNINPAGTYSFQWSTSSGTVVGSSTAPQFSVNTTLLTNSVVITLTLSGVNTCSSVNSYIVYPCCNVPTATTIYPPNYTFTTNTTITTGTLVFSGTVKVNPGVLVFISGTEIVMQPGTKVNILGNGSLTIEKSYIHGCIALWDGIYTYNNSVIFLESNIIEDARRVLTDTLGAQSIAVGKNIFNKNYIGVVFRNSLTTNNLLFNSNAFTSSNLSLSAISYSVPVIVPIGILHNPTTYTVASQNLLPPYSSLTSLYGVEFINTRDAATSGQIKLGFFGVGVNNSFQNLFDKLSRGVLCDNSSVQIRNGYFQNHFSGPFGGAGVYIKGSYFGKLTNFSNVKVGGLVPEKCYFNNNANGILNTYPSTVEIRNNQISNCADGIFAINNSRNRNFLTINNDFNNNAIGIQMAYNVAINAQILNNNFTNSVSVGNTTNNYAGWFVEVNSTAGVNAFYNVYNNTVSGFYNGFQTSGTYSSQVTTNDITLRADNSGTTAIQSGINSTACELPYIFNNNLTMIGAAGFTNLSWQRGVELNSNTLPSVLCNTTMDMRTGIKINGLNWTALTGGGICGNSISKYIYGVWLDASGHIGDQFFGNPIFPTTKFASDNQWPVAQPINYGKTVVTGNSNNGYIVEPSVFYTRTTPASYVIGASHTPTLGCVFGNGCPLLGVINSPTTFNVCTGGIPPFRLIQRALEIAKDSLNFPVNNANLQHLSKRILHRNLVLQNINVTGNTDLSNFLQASKNNNFGKFYLVDSLFNSELVNDSTGLKMSNGVLANNSIFATNSIEQNQKTVNNIFASYVNNNFSIDSTQVSDLENIAVLCPMIDGMAVYEARGILFVTKKKKYLNTCENTFTDNANARLMNPNEETEVEKLGEVKLYPNPSTNEVYVETGSYSNCELQMYDVVGKLVIAKTINGKERLDVNQLSNGIYIYQIRNNEVILKTDKLIINR